MQEALEDFKPDIVHLNNFQRQLSASIIDANKKKKIYQLYLQPMIYKLFVLRFLCLIIKQEVCEKCLGGKYSNCFKNKCNKGSTLKKFNRNFRRKIITEKNRIYSRKDRSYYYSYRIFIKASL